jgi:hypothetical protein
MPVAQGSVDRGGVRKDGDEGHDLRKRYTQNGK